MSLAIRLSGSLLIIFPGRIAREPRARQRQKNPEGAKASYGQRFHYKKNALFGKKRVTWSIYVCGIVHAQNSTYRMAFTHRNKKLYTRDTHKLTTVLT